VRAADNLRVMGNTKGHDAMENPRSRLHPLLTAAAISVTVFSAVGVATMTGLVPQSISSSKETAAVAPFAATEAMKPVEAAKPVDVAQPVEPALAPPPAKTVQKPVKRAAAPRKVEPVVYRDAAEEPRIAQAETPKPVVQRGQVGTVQSVREVAQAGEHTALGPIAGGVAGAVIGNQFGHGNGKKILTVLGAAGGAYAGREIEKQARATKRWEIAVRLDNGTQETVLSEVAPPFNPGDRVRVVEGRLQPI
jgi:outer membrane lipoprotein SlyB